MITVALAALAYTWFTGIFATLTASATTATTTATTAMGTSFRIEAAKYTGSNNVNATIRNVGSSSFSATTTKLGAYIGGISQTVSTVDPSGVLASGGTATLKITNGTVACGNTLAITIETGLTDSKTIPSC